jgi:hypothetical protein
LTASSYIYDCWGNGLDDEIRPDNPSLLKELILKTASAICFVLIFTLPAFAQDDSGSIQNSFGYANLSFPNLFTGQPGHHSGFANQTDLNLSKRWGLDNYMGLYSLGQGVTLFSDFFGGRVMFPRGKMIPYALAGLGGGYFSSGSGGASAFATRLGGGVTIPMNDSLAWKAEYSRMNFRLQTGPDSQWTSGNNLSVGVVFTISN